ncbi:MAG: hypothetical protein J5658_03815 [Prevotella sp.]|nr:hypothetical protein [Prevotella sp.]
MIHTDIDIKDELWTWVSQSNLATMVTGSVYKDQRPLNSEAEDIVIAVIARTAGAQMQQATANVNIYVADKRRGREAIEDTARLRALCTEAASLFAYKHDGDAIYELDSQEVMKVYGADWHIINNQISIRYNNE